MGVGVEERRGQGENGAVRVELGEVERGERRECVRGFRGAWGLAALRPFTFCTEIFFSPFVPRFLFYFFFHLLYRDERADDELLDCCEESVRGLDANITHQVQLELAQRPLAAGARVVPRTHLLDRHVGQVHIRVSEVLLRRVVPMRGEARKARAVEIADLGERGGGRIYWWGGAGDGVGMAWGCGVRVGGRGKVRGAG